MEPTIATNTTSTSSSHSNQCKMTVRTSVPTAAPLESKQLPTTTTTSYSSLSSIPPTDAEIDSIKVVTNTNTSKHVLVGTYNSARLEHHYCDPESVRSVFLYFEGLEGRVRRVKITDDCSLVDLYNKAQILFGKFLTAVAAGDFYMVCLFYSRFL